MRFVRSPGFRNIYRKSSGIIISIGFCGAVVASDCINICLSFDGIAVCVDGIGIPDICQPFPSGGRSFAENTVIITSGSSVSGNGHRFFVSTKGSAVQLYCGGFCICGQSSAVIASVGFVSAVITSDCVGVFLSRGNRSAFGRCVCIAGGAAAYCGKRCPLACAGLFVINFVMGGI